ncbi:MAG: thermonuclease family protein [Thermodesulfobacteriota bacterium]
MNCALKHLIFSQLLFLFLSSYCFADSRYITGQGYTGTVTRVFDGDTVAVRTKGGRTIKVRLYGVDCPERARRGEWSEQAGNKDATEFTRAFVFKKEVRVRLTGDKTHKRVVGEVFIDDTSLSSELVAKGLCWWNWKFAPDDTNLKGLQKKARAERIGLWKDGHLTRPIPPWVHRRKKR